MPIATQEALVARTSSKKKMTTRRSQPPRNHRSVIPADQADAPQRRRDILLAAAQLFAAHGYNGVSIRDIARQAKVPATLCSYYFGRKSELFTALFLHSPDHIEKRRKELEDLADDGSLEELVRLWIGPILAMRSNDEESPFAILFARASWDSSAEAKEAVKRFYDPIAFAVLLALTRLLPNRSYTDLAWGYEWALGAFLMHLANDRVESVSRGRVTSADLGSKTENLIHFICAGLRSIPSSNRGEKKRR
jgi:AcrR family transcriptional regulator